MTDEELSVMSISWLEAYNADKKGVYREKDVLNAFIAGARLFAGRAIDMAERYQKQKDINKELLDEKEAYIEYARLSDWAFDKISEKVDKLTIMLEGAGK